ncbi:PglZ domain-containing protein [Aeribacillus pallidus]|nr:PglZ domain-containing protein [Aeribacillus pallidus]
MKKSFYDMVATSINNLFQKRPIVIWVDEYQSFISEYERYIKEEHLEKFIFTGSFMQLRHMIVNYSPHFEKRILIYLPIKFEEIKLLKEYQWLAEIFDDTIRDLLAKHYNLQLPINENDRLHKQLQYIKAKWDILSEDLIENLDEVKLEQIILQNQLTMDELDKKETLLKFMTDKTYYESLKELENLQAFLQLANEYYGFLFDEQQSYEEIVEVIASSLIQTELSLNSKESDYELDPKIAYRRSELFNLWSKHDFYRNHFKEWSKKLSYKYKQEISLKEIEELYTIEGFSIIDEELWSRIEKQLLLSGELNIELLSFEKIEQFILIAESRITRAIESNLIQKWKALSELLQFINELNKFKNYVSQTGNFQNPESIISEYIKQNWWSIDFHFRKAQENYKQNNLLIHELINYANGQYIHHFLKPINTQFQKSIENKNYFSIDGIPQQRYFWQEYINESNNKIAVIFVDALRYEMGIELQHLIDEEWQVDVDSMLSSLPSITKIGMASLLPLSSTVLTWEKEKDDLIIYSDNTKMNNKSNRVKYLETVMGTHGQVYNLDNLYRFTEQQIKMDIADKEKIVVYSNEIDAAGEHIEDSAVNIFPELLHKIKIVTENLLRAGVEKVVITADHGFLLTNGLEGWNEISISDEVDLIKKSRRYAIATNKIKGDWIVKEISWSHHKGNLYQYYPLSNYYFTANGGTKFSHGGISIQEVIIPVLIITSKNSSKDFIEDPRIIQQQTSLIEVNQAEDTANIQEQIKHYLITFEDDLSKREIFLLNCFLDSTKWSEMELLQRAKSKGIKFKSILVSEAMEALINKLENQGKKWFTVEMINGTMYEYSLK